uniref:Si:ch211-62a1.3 n=1 Tax=Sinocyclocheilus grahami TaxID=75366 RepID=A0A672LTS4_SINGR
MSVHFMNFLFLDCEGLFADVVFLLDGSESVSAKDFENMKDIMELVIDKFAIGPDKERVAVIQYGTDPNEELSLNKFDDKAVLLQKIRNIKQMNGKTYTGKALTEVLQSFFDISKGGRSNALKFLIVLTDGESRDDVAEPAKVLRDNSININAIGMRHANRSQILAIAGSHDGVFFEDAVASLKELSNDVLLKICNTECKRPELIDIIFLVDTSGSPNKDGFQEMINLMKYTVSKSVVGEKRVRFGAVTYSNNPRSEFTLNKYYSQTDILRVISNLKASGGSRNTAQALNYALSYFGDTHGGRRAKNVPQVLFLITDGKVNDLSGLATWPESLTNSEVNFFAIGTEDADEQQLKEMVENKGRVHYANTYQDLRGLQKRITQELCNLTKPICEMEVSDIVFLIDGSETIMDASWNTLKKTMIGIVKELDIAQDKWRVGVAQFSREFQKEFYLNNYTSFTEVEKAINDIVQQKQGTSTWDALRNIRYYFTKENGSRIDDGVAQNLLLITDGYANDAKDLNALSYLKNKNILITVIGVGNDIKKSELREIAGSPERVLIETFEGLKLNTTIRKVLHLLCTVTRPEPSPPYGCDIDIAFGFDVSRRTITETLLTPQVEQLVTAAIHRISVMGDLCCIEKENITTRFGYRLVSGRDGSVLENLGFEEYKEDVVKKVMLLRPTAPLAFNEFLLESFREMFASSSVKVLIIFTDGLDDNIQRLMASSGRLKESGVSALLIVSLEGIMDVHQLEFGRGFGYMQPLTVNMLNLGNDLMKQVETVALRKCCDVHCSCTGVPGPRGPPASAGQKGLTGQNGHPGFPGDEGSMGEQGSPGLNGTTGHKGCPGNRGIKGEDGEDGLDGVDGEQGDAGLNGLPGPKGDLGRAGVKGFRGSPGPKGHSGLRGDPGAPGIDNTILGPKGKRGDTGLPVSLLGASSNEKGEAGQPGGFYYCFFLDNGSRCPVYPTDLVIALDMSEGVTPLVFERMHSAALSLLEDISFAETNCPCGARVSVISYSSKTRNLIRFADHLKKTALLEAVKAVALERTTKTRDIGQAMSFVARNVFKRVRKGRLMRKVAVFFTNGPSRDESSLATAMLEFKAADIGLGVITLNPADDVSRAMQVDDTGSYIVVDGRGVNRIKQCIVCFDRCNPDPVCGVILCPQPLQMDLDLSVLLDGSDNLNTQQYVNAKELLLSLLDQIGVSSEPSRADGETRVSVYQQSSIYGSSYINEEFSFTKFKDRNIMKRHITNTVKQVGGTSHPEFALEWLITNVILKAERPRSKRMVMAVFGEDSEHSKAHLDYLSRLCKCQNVVMFILMAGQRFDWTRMEELTSSRLEQHLVFLDDRDYSTRFAYAFLRMLHRGILPRSSIQPRDCRNLPSTIVRHKITKVNILPTKAPTEELIETEEPLEDYEDVYNEQNIEPITEPSQPDDIERFTGEHKEDHTEPPKTKARCFLEKDSGHVCGSYMSRWYYSQQTKKCMRFWYGGCGGNENRFLTEDECFRECVFVQISPTESENLPQDDSISKGTCSNFSVKWYYDVSSGQCFRFWYGGCDGNSNRFNTQKDCEIRCLRARKVSPNI